MEMADRMAEDGFKDAGYEYVSIDVSFLYLHFNVYIHYIASLWFVSVLDTSLNEAKLCKRYF